MSRWMLPETALIRVVMDDKAPIMARVRSLQQIDHPPLTYLRKLLIKNPKIPRRKPVPSKLAAVAAQKYAQEMALRRTRKSREAQMKKLSNNPLGIVL